MLPPPCGRWAGGEGSQRQSTLQHHHPLLSKEREYACSCIRPLGDLPVPPWLETISVGPVVLFTFVLARVSGLVTTLPMFTGPADADAGAGFLTVALALVLTPTQWHAQPPPPTNLAEYVFSPPANC